MKVSKYRKKNGETAWRVDIHLGRDPLTGKKRNTTLRGFSTEKQAYLAGTRRLTEKRIKSGGKSVTFEEVCDEWLETYRLTVKESTFISQLFIINRYILPKLGDMRVKQITPQLCQEAVNHWYSNYKNYSNMIGLASRILEYARVHLQLIRDNPMKDTIRPKRRLKIDERKYEAPYYSRQQLLYFLECVEELGDPQASVVFRIIAFTGMREGEVVGLKWTDFNESKGTLTVRRSVARGEDYKRILQTPKTPASQREISLDPVTINVLKRWKKEQRKILSSLGFNIFSKEQFIISDENNNFQYAGYPYALLKKLRKKSDIDYITVHGLRHTHCTLLIESGIPIKEVQKRLGHENSDMVMEVYSHINKDRMGTIGSDFANFVEK